MNQSLIISNVDKGYIFPFGTSIKLFIKDARKLEFVCAVQVNHVC